MSIRWTIATTAGLLSLAAAHAQGPSLDDLLGIPTDAPAPANEPPADATDPDDPADAADAALRRRLADEHPADSFEQALQEMRDAATRLADRRDAGPQTQRLQERVLARLDEVIAAASQPQGGGGGQSAPRDADADPNAQPNPAQARGGQPGQADQPANNPSQGGFSPGQVGPVAPDDRSLDELRREWGTLPARLRQELADGLDEPFSAAYRAITEQYYRRLAEETP